MASTWVDIGAVDLILGVTAFTGVFIDSVSLFAFTVETALAISILTEVIPAVIAGVAVFGFIAETGMEMFVPTVVIVPVMAGVTVSEPKIKGENMASI